MKKRIVVIFTGILLSCSAHAELTCKGKAHGLDLAYVFTKSGRDLSVNAKVFMNGSIIEDEKGTAKYSSTVKSEFLKNSTAESYYVFSRGADSYTELIGISFDLKSMASSRPDPISDSGNFCKLSCSGSI